MDFKKFIEKSLKNKAKSAYFSKPKLSNSLPRSVVQGFFFNDSMEVEKMKQGLINDVKLFKYLPNFWGEIYKTVYFRNNPFFYEYTFD